VDGPLTNAWRKPIAIVAALEPFLKTLNGMTGYAANFASTRKKAVERARPTHIIEMTFGDFQSEI